MAYRPLKLSVKGNDRNLDTISFPSEITNTLRTNAGEKITITAGCSKYTITIAEQNQENITSISQNIMDRLGLYNGQTINLLQLAKNKFKLGPYFGVFINIGAIKSISLGNPHQRLLELAKAGLQESVVTYFFSIRDVNWPQYHIKGYCYDTCANTWRQLVFPLPDVLYDRGGGFLAKQLPIAKYIRKQFSLDEKLQKLNVQHYFNKWRNHRILSEHKDMRKYLPDTVQYEDVDDLARMLKAYSCVYLKACEGSNGRQVMRVKTVESNEYELNYFDKEVITRNTNSLEEIIQTANRLFNCKSFIIQQGVDVLEYQGNNVDMRALLQRNSTGEWQLTAVPVRIAHDHCGITSTSTGSNCYQFDYAFTRLLGFSNNELDKLKQKVTNLLFTAVKTIEAEYGKFGELGIDLALDKKGNVWFIESNAKPGKDTILLSGNEDASKRCFLVPLQYAKYLTGFNGEQNE